MEAKKQFSKIGLILVLATIILNGMQLIAVEVFNKIPAIASNNDLLFMACMIPGYFIGYPLIFLLFKIVPKQLEGERKKMKVSHIIIAFFITYAVTYLSNLIGTLFLAIVSAFKQAPVENVLQALLEQISPWTTLLIAVILAPIFEELLFRKAILDRTSKYGEGISIVFSGLMFGLFHGNFSQFIYAMCLGMLFGFIYLKTKNIIYPIILHVLTNFMGSVVPMFVLSKSRYMEFAEKLAPLMENPEHSDTALLSLMAEYAGGILLFFGYLILIFGMIIAGIIFFLINRKKFVLTPGEITIEKGERFKTVCLNPGVILFVVFWIAMIIWQMFS